MLTRSAGAAALVVALTACGSAARSRAAVPATSTSAPSTTSSTSATSTTTSVAPTTSTTMRRTTTTVAAIVRLGASDDRRTVQVARGTTVAVDLRTQGQRWSEPQSSDQRVLTRTSGGEDAQTGEATAKFTAAATGSAQVAATGGALCPPDQPCPMYAMQWSVTIEVQ